jgi:hypothetical protein
MEAFQKIQLAFKCPKALDELQPCQNNWYCDGCQKMVYDFRGFSETQILDTFAQSGQKLCGIYDADRIKVLPQKPRWYTWASAAMFVFGLAACNNYAMGERMIISPRVDSIRNKPVHHSKVHHRKTAKKVKAQALENYTMGVVSVDVTDKLPDVNVLNAQNRPLPVIKTDTTQANYLIGDVIEVAPSFPGGEAAWQKYVHDHLKYSGNYKGRIFVQFVIEENGVLSDVNIVKGGDAELNQIIVHIIKNSPHWKPGIQSGRPYRSQYTVPINFPVKEK